MRPSGLLCCMRQVLLWACLGSGAMWGASYTWSTAAGGTWDSAANWGGGGFPVAGDTAIIGTINAGSTITIPAGGAACAALSITTNNGFTVTGGTLTLAGGLTDGTSSSARTRTFSCDIVLGANSTWNINDGDNTYSCTGIIDDGVSTFSLSKSGTGILRLLGANTYGGGMSMSAGTLTIGSSTALGTGTFTVSGGTIQSDATAVVATNPVTVAGNFTMTTVSTNALNLAGAITLTGNRQITASSSTSNMSILSGGIGESGGARTLTKAGTSSLILGGTSTYTGGTTVSAGILVFGSDAGAGTGTITCATGTFIRGFGTARTVANAIAIAGTVTVNTGVDLTLNGIISGSGILANTGSAVVTLAGANSYSGGTTCTGGTIALGHATALGTGTATLNGSAIRADTAARTIANAWSWTGTGSVTGSLDLTLNGAVTLTGNMVLTVSTTGVFLVAGAIGESGGARTFGKAGTASMTVSAANTFTGTCTVSAGTLVCANSSGSATGTGALVVSSGATLAGTGTTTATSTTLTGSCAPAGAGVVGTLALAALNASTSSASTDVIRLDLPAVGVAGTDYDRLAVTGAVTLGGTSRLEANLAGLSLGGLTVFDPMTCGSASGLIGTVSTTNNPSGYSVNVATRTDRIRVLVGPGGNDRTWTGGGGDALWSTTANWLGGTPPLDGDRVVFDANSTANLATSADYAPLVGILLTTPAGAVSIAGSLRLAAAGIDLSGASQDLSISAPITLAAAQTWTVATSRTLALTSTATVATAGVVLSTAGAGTITCAGVISGTGGLTVGGGTVSMASGLTNTYTGLTTIDDGTLAVASERGFGAVGNDVTFAGGTLRCTGATAFASTNALTVTGADPIRLETATSITATLPSSGIAVSANGMVVSGSGTLTVSAAQAGVTGLTVSGGTVNCTIANAFPTTVVVATGGTFVAADIASAISSTTVQLTGGRLRLQASNARNVGGAIQVLADSEIECNRPSAGTSADITIGTLSLSAVVTLTKGSNFTSGQPEITTGVITIAASGAGLTTPTTLDVIGGRITDGGAGRTLTKSGAGTVQLNTASTTGTFTGMLVISAGTVFLTPAQALDTATVEIDVGGTLQVSTATNVLGAATVRLDGGTFNPRYSSTDTLGGTLIAATTGSLVRIDRTSSGAAGQTLSVNALRVLADLTIDNGSLSTSGSGALGVVGDLSIETDATITLRAGTGFGGGAGIGALTVNSTGSVTDGGTPRTVIVQGSGGTFRVNGDSTQCTGLFRMDAGTLDLRAANALHQADVTLNGANMNVQVTTSGDITLMSGDLLVDQSGTITCTASNAAHRVGIGSLTLQAAALTTNTIDGILRITGATTITEAATWTIGGSTGSVICAGALGNAGVHELDKAGAGTLALQAAGAYAGTFRMRNGILTLQHADALGPTGSKATIQVASNVAGNTDLTIRLIADADTDFGNPLTVLQPPSTQGDLFIITDRNSAGSLYTMTLGDLSITSAKVTVQGGNSCSLQVADVDLAGTANLVTATNTGRLVITGAMTDDGISNTLSPVSEKSNVTTTSTPETGERGMQFQGGSASVITGTLGINTTKTAFVVVDGAGTVVTYSGQLLDINNGQRLSTVGTIRCDIVLRNGGTWRFGAGARCNGDPSPTPPDTKFDFYPTTLRWVFVGNGTVELMPGFDGSDFNVSTSGTAQALRVGRCTFVTHGSENLPTTAHMQCEGEADGPTWQVRTADQVFSSRINFLVDGTTIDVATGLTLDCTGDQDGVGTVEKTGAGTWRLLGANAASSTGTWTVSGGTLALGKDADVAAHAGVIRVANGGTLRWLEEQQITPTGTLQVDVGGTCDLDGFEDGIGTLRGDGVVSDGQLNIGVALVPGTVGTVATLTVDDLRVKPAASWQVDLLTPGASDQVVVAGDLLELEGTLEVTPGVGFASGSYVLATCAGARVATSGMTVTGLPAGYTGAIDLRTAGQVRLTVSQGPSAPALISPVDCPDAGAAGIAGDDVDAFGSTTAVRPWLIWGIPEDPQADDVHFDVCLDTSAGTTQVASTITTGDLPDFAVYDGTTWSAFPAAGVPHAVGGSIIRQVRWRPPTAVLGATATPAFWSVRARDGTEAGPFSAVRRFVIDPTLTPVTVFRAVHLTELRTAANRQRILRGLAAATWTDAMITPGVTPIRAVHLTELRTAMAGLDAVLGTTTAFVPTTIAAGDPIRLGAVTDLQTVLGGL
jgi:fibronectin-binding autotransporter adhesin